MWGLGFSLAGEYPDVSKAIIWSPHLNHPHMRLEHRLSIKILAPLQPKNCTVSNVFHDNCVVNWQPPDDDGGTEITGYIVEVNNDNLYKDTFRQID